MINAKLSSILCHISVDIILVAAQIIWHVFDHTLIHLGVSNSLLLQIKCHCM